MNIKRALKKKQTKETRELLNRLPKPPVADGVCACGCHFRPQRGACPEYTRGPKELEDAENRRCGVCDHDIRCHRRKGEAPPKDWDFYSYLLSVRKFPLKWIPPRLLKKYDEEQKNDIRRENQINRNQHQQQDEAANLSD